MEVTRASEVCVCARTHLLRLPSLSCGRRRIYRLVVFKLAHSVHMAKHASQLSMDSCCFFCNQTTAVAQLEGRKRWKSFVKDDDWDH